MSVELEKLFEIAVRPLSDNAQRRFDAANLLKVLRDENSGDVEEMIRRWEEVDARQRKPLWNAVGLFCFAVSLAVVMGLNFPEWMNLIFRKDPFDRGYPAAEQRISSRLTPEQRLMMFGKTETADQDNPRHAMWRKSPEDPALFADYVLAKYVNLPTNLLDDAGRIDPDNAYWLYLAAGMHAPNHASSGNGVMQQTINGYIRKANDLPRCDSYQIELLRKRIPLLPQSSLVDRKASLYYIDFTYKQIRPELDHVAQWISRQADSDAKAMTRLIQDADGFLKSICRMEAGMLEEEQFIARLAAGLARNLSHDARKAGLESEAARWKTISDRFDERSKGYFKRSFLVDGKPVATGERTGYLLTGHFEKEAITLVSQPYISDASLQPGRDFDHEFFSRYSAYALWFLLGGVLLLLSLYRLRMTPMIHRLALRMPSLLRPVDWVWILAGGVLLPMVYVMAINRFTPLGARSLGMMGSHLLLPMAHFAGLGILWICAWVMSLRWRMRVRAGALGFGKENPLLGMLAVICAVAFIPFVGWAAVYGRLPKLWIRQLDWVDAGIQGRGSEAALWIAAILLVIPTLWLLSISLLSLIDGSRHILHRATASRILASVCTSAMALLLCLTLWFKWEEENAYQRDTWSKLSADHPSTSRLHYQLAVQARKEIREILGIHDGS